MQRIHRGLAFDVYKFTDDAGTWAFKVPAAGPPRDREWYATTATLGGVSTVWNLITRTGVVASWQRPEALLEDEAARIRATAGAWNHEVRSVGPMAGPDGAPVFGLCTRWFEGTPLGALPRATQRELFPRMLPALWDALTVAAHGDLHGDNLVVADRGDRFALIDPGAMIVSSTGRSGPSSGSRTLTFVTHAATYPLLPPYLEAGPEVRLADAWRRFLTGATVSGQYPPVEASGGTLRQDFDHLPRLAVPQPAGRPLPADLLATGILYYQILTGRHPWPLAVERGPAWSGLEVVDDRLTGHELGGSCVDRPPPSARSSDPSIDPAISSAEASLAMALLDLATRSRDELVDRVRAVQSSGQGRAPGTT